MPQRSRKEVERHIAAGELKNVYLLHGEERFLQERLAEKLRRAALGEGGDGGEYVRLWAEDTPASDLLMHIGSMSLFAAPKLVLVSFEKDFDYRITAGHGLFGAVRNPPPQTHVVIVCRGAITKGGKKGGKSAKTKKASKKADDDKAASGFLRENHEFWNECAEMVSFPMLWERDALDELGAWAVEQGIRFADREALKYLLERSGSTLGRATAEAYKCWLYLGFQGRIDEAVIDEVTPLSVEGKVFAMLDSLMGGDLGDAMDILEQLRREKTQDIMILNAFAGQLRRLIEARSLARYVKVPPRYNKAGVQQIHADARERFKDRMPAGNNILARTPFAFWRLMNQSRGLDAELLWDNLNDCYKTDMALKGRGKEGMQGPQALDILLMKAFASFNRG